MVYELKIELTNWNIYMMSKDKESLEQKYNEWYLCHRDNLLLQCPNVSYTISEAHRDERHPDYIQEVDLIEDGWEWFGYYNGAKLCAAPKGYQDKEYPRTRYNGGIQLTKEGEPYRLSFNIAWNFSLRNDKDGCHRYCLGHFKTLEELYKAMEKAKKELEEYDNNK